MSAMRRSQVAGQVRAQSVSIRPVTPFKDGSTMIIPAHIRVLEGIYFTAMLEEARAFQAVDQLAEQFAQGSLPIDSGRTAELLYQWWKNTHQRFTAVQRHTLYQRAFGPSRDGGMRGDRKFDDLWVRFLPTVGMYVAEMQLPREARSVTQDEIRNRAHELAVELSQNGSGFNALAAQDLRTEVQEVFRILGDPQVEQALGVRGPWRVMERLTASETGRRPNILRSRTRAESGSIIIRWLSNRPKLLAHPTAAVLKEEDLRKLRTAASPLQQRTHPTDYDLVMACEQWLAVTGTQEADLDPNELPAWQE